MTKAEELRRLADALAKQWSQLDPVDEWRPDLEASAAALRDYAESLEREPKPKPYGFVVVNNFPDKSPYRFMFYTQEQIGGAYKDNALEIVSVFTHPPLSEPVDNHASDCATHNSPAYPNGPCDCQPTQAMCRAAVEYINGAGVYSKVPSEALEIEEGIYAEVWKAMQAAAPNPEPAIKQRLTTEPPKMTEAAAMAQGVK